MFIVAEVPLHQSHPRLSWTALWTIEGLSADAIMTLPDCMFVWVTHTSVGMLPGPAWR